MILKDTIAVFLIPKDFPLEQLVKQFRDGLYGYHTAAVKTERLYEMKADSFAQAGYRLYDQLISPFGGLLTKEVVIVPDGVLGYIPFEALLSEAPREPTAFKSHAYFGRGMC